MKKYLIAAVILAAILLPEAVLRIYFRALFSKQPSLSEYLPYNIPGVPYLQIELEKISPQKKKPRIIVIGDYIARHRSGEDNADYPQLLEKKLAGSYEVINASAAFYSLPQELSLLEHMLNYKPEIVIWSYVYNDLYFDVYEYAAIPLALKRRITEPLPVIPLAVKYWNAEIRLQRLKELYKRKDEMINLVLDSHLDPGKRKALKECLGRLKQLEEEKGIKAIFIIIPVFYEFSDPRISRIDGIVSFECRSAGLECISMLDIFKSYGVSAVKENDGDIWHQNYLGNRLIMEELYKRIKATERQKMTFK